MRFVITWGILAAFWLGLSGHLRGVPLWMGLASVTLVTVLTARAGAADEGLRHSTARLLRLGLYSPWLLWRVWKANVDVLLRVAGLRSVDPRIIRIQPRLETDFGKVALANSITLTPGTVTIEIQDGEFIVHAIAPEVADPQEAGEMARRVRWVEGKPS